ncbi:MAG: TraR/DksA family transcriptional regulator [Bryobacteraceae bacterium]
MAANQYTCFRQLLEATLAELDGSVTRRDSIMIENSADSLDRVVGAAERELAVLRLEASSVRLRDARAALSRIQNGTFGECLQCGDPIRPARLAAIPWAPLCIDCQQDADSNRGRAIAA